MADLELFYSSPSQYEKVTIEIQLNRECIAEVNQETGIYHLELSFLLQPRKRGSWQRCQLMT